MSRNQPKRPRPPAPLTGNGSRLWVLLAAISATFYAVLFFYPRLFWYVGLQHYDIWFADTYALLASGDAVTQGLNPYAPNPLDVFHRPHVYSHWWLALRHLGLTRADISWLGPLIVVTAWLAALRWLRPRNRYQFWFALAVLISSPILLAFERANNDLVIFLLLAPLVSCLLSSRGGIRLLAPALIAVAAGLKYYPAAAGLLLLAPTTGPEFRRRLLLGIGLLAIAAASVAGDLAVFGPLAPKPSGWLSFGATTAFTSLGWSGWAPAVVCLAMGALLFAWGWRSTRLNDWSPSADSHGDWLRFVLGAVLLTGCFLTSANFAYRWIFALWLPPFLWTLAANSAAPNRSRTFASVTAWLLIAVLWLDTVFTWVAIALQGNVAPDTIRAWVRISILLEQPVAWSFFGCLLFFLARFTKDGIRQLRAAP